MDKLFEAVSFGEAGHHAVQMLEYAPNEIVRHADVQRAAWLVR
jgi:hypothetical protein